MTRPIPLMTGRRTGCWTCRSKRSWPCPLPNRPRPTDTDHTASEPNRPNSLSLATQHPHHRRWRTRRQTCRNAADGIGRDSRRSHFRCGFSQPIFGSSVNGRNDLRVFAARSRRGSSVGRTRGVERRSSAMEISTGALDAGAQDHRSGGGARGAGAGYRVSRRAICPVDGIIWGKVREWL